MFKKILHANDGSESAFKALTVAIELATTYKAELHMVSVEEIPYLPEMIEEVKAEKGAADRRFRNVLSRARALASARGIKLECHVLVGHPVRTIVELVSGAGFELLVIGATGHSAFYERMIGSRADRLVQLTPCPVLVVK